jgi:hypothetical protein
MPNLRWRRWCYSRIVAAMPRRRKRECDIFEKMADGGLLWRQTVTGKDNAMPGPRARHSNVLSIHSEADCFLLLAADC